MTTHLNQLKALKYIEQLIFAYLTCERLYPNYVFFSQQFGFGSPAVLRQAIDYIYHHLLNETINGNTVEALLSKIDPHIPAPEHFNTILASSAFDAATAIEETLNFTRDKDFNRIITISSIASDSVDMYIQERDNLDNNSDANFEIRISNDPLMVREIKTQTGIIAFLTKIQTITVDDVTTLLQLQENNGKGNLNL